MAEINLNVQCSPGMDYGISFDSMTGRVRGYPLQPQNPEEIPATGGRQSGRGPAVTEHDRPVVRAPT